MNTSASSVLLQADLDRIAGIRRDLALLPITTPTERRMRDSVLDDLASAERMINALDYEMKERK